VGFVVGGKIDNVTGSSSSTLRSRLSFNHCSVLTNISSGGWTKSLLEAQCHTDMVSPHCNSRNYNNFHNLFPVKSTH
jgi:hypothetical protein